GSRDPSGFAEPGDLEAAVTDRPRSGDDASGEHQVGRAARRPAPPRRDDLRVVGARPHHPRIAPRQQPDSGRGPGRLELLEILPQDKGPVALDRDGFEPVAEALEPAVDGLALDAEARAQPALHPLRCGWAVDPEVRLYDARAGLREVGNAAPPRHGVEAEEGGLAVAADAEPHVPLPGQRLEQRVVAVGDV